MKVLGHMLLAGIVITFVLFLAYAKIWITGSLITSSVKAISGNCATTYKIERFVSGTWFCPELK